MSARVCPLSNKKGKSTNIQPGRRDKQSNEDNSGNFQNYLKFKLIRCIVILYH